MDTARVFIYRDDLKPINLIEPCRRDYQSFGFDYSGYAQQCLDCLILKDATLKAPWFW